MRWEGGNVVRWEDGRVVRWEGGKGGRMVGQKCGKHLVLFKGGGHKMSPRFHLFVFGVNKENEGVG